MTGKPSGPLIVSPAVYAELVRYRENLLAAMNGVRDNDIGAIEDELHDLDERIRTVISDCFVLDD
jgi:hypothetical protein